MREGVTLNHAERIMRAAQDYKEQGLTPVRIEAGGKKAKDTAWPDKDPLPHDFASGYNIGFQPGKKSGHVVDLDYDDPVVREIAGWNDTAHAAYPPFRRESQSRHAPGHRLVKSTDAPDTFFRFQCTKAEEKEALQKAGIGTANFAEIRSGKCYTVLPPSRYAKGDDPADGFDELVWEKPFDASNLPEVSYVELHRSTALIVFLALARYCYPAKGGRHDYSVPLAGALIELGESADDAAYYIERLARMAEDEEAESRAAVAHGTAEKYAGGEPIAGLSKFLAEAGLDALEKTIRKWFKLDTARAPVPIPPDAINVNAVDLEAQLLKLDRQLASSGLLFRQGGRFATISDVSEAFEAPLQQVFRRTHEARPVTAKWLIAVISRLKIDMRNARGDKIQPPEWFAKVYLDWCSESELPVLAGITHTPLLSRHFPGYDPETGIFHAYSAGDFPPIPDNLSKDDAQKALVILSRPLSEYHFANAASRSVALAAMLTATVRVEIANAPMFVFDASVPASGKSKLMSSVGVMALGKIPAFTTFAKSDEENRKRLEASLIARQQVIAIDNVSDIMDNDTLAAILTGQSMSPRILGRSETLTVDTRVMLMATGNNISVHGDMARRVLKCRIEPPHTNPEEVRYSFDPVQRAIANHRELVVAALTILRAYRQSGQKVETMRFGSFEGWEFIAKALVWLGEADPNLTRLEVKAGNPMREERERIVALFLGYVGLGVKITVRALHRTADYARFRDELATMLRDGAWNEIAAGRKLGQLVGAIIGGMTLHSAPSKTNSNEYWLAGVPTDAIMALKDELIGI